MFLAFISQAGLLEIVNYVQLLEKFTVPSFYITSRTTRKNLNYISTDSALE